MASKRDKRRTERFAEEAIGDTQFSEQDRIAREEMFGTEGHLSGSAAEQARLAEDFQGTFDIDYDLWGKYSKQSQVMNFDVTGATKTELAPIHSEMKRAYKQLSKQGTSAERQAFKAKYGSYKEYAADPTNLVQGDIQISGARQFEEMIGKATEWRQEAEQLARSGDRAGAEALLDKANAVAEELKSATQGRGSSVYLEGSSQTAEERAAIGLDSPMARAAGQIAKEGREFLDRDSETSRRFRENLTRGAEETLQRGAARTKREAAREVRDLGRSQGGLRNVAREQAVTQAFEERLEGDTAGRIAAMDQQADQYFESVRTSMARDAIGYARAFIEGSPEVRDTYVQNMAQMKFQAAGISMQFAQMAQQAEMAQQGGGLEGLLGQLAGGLGGSVGSIASAFI